MSVTWKYIKPLENKSAVTDFMNNYGIKAPKSLVSLLEKYNGGRPSEKKIVTDTGREYVFKSLLSFNPKDKDSVLRIYSYVFDGTSLFPFGSDAAGNIVCFDTKSKKYVLYNHETDKAEVIIEKPFL